MSWMLAGRLAVSGWRRRWGTGTGRDSAGRPVMFAKRVKPVSGLEAASSSVGGSSGIVGSAMASNCLKNDARSAFMASRTWRAAASWSSVIASPECSRARPDCDTPSSSPPRSHASLRHASPSRTSSPASWAAFQPRRTTSTTVIPESRSAASIAASTAWSAGMFGGRTRAI